MQVISSKDVKIRKPHNCWGCTTLFEPPTVMECSVSTEGTQIMSAYWCKTCQGILDTMSYYDTQAGFCYGDLKEQQ